MTKTNFIKSFSFAIKGIFYGTSKEQNIKIQIMIGLFIIFLSIILRIPKIEFIIILIISFLVIILELLNTCFEKLIDLINPDYHIEFGKIKDIMAGVVLIGTILSILVGFLILYNPLVDFIKINFSFLFALNVFLILGIVIIIYLIITYS